MQTIKEELRTGSFSPLHLIYGEERYMVKYLKNSIVKKMGMEEDEMNYSYYEGENISISEVVDVAQTMPFFAERRLVILENTGWFKSANDFADYLPDIPESTVLVFVEKEIDKRNRLYKAVQKKGVVTEETQENEQALVRWVSNYLKAAGHVITQKDIYYLLHKVGMSMVLVATELEKLIGYVGDREVIEQRDIDAICSAQLGDKIFDLLDAVGEQNMKKAMELYHNELGRRESARKMIALFIRHMNVLLIIKEQDIKHASDGDIAKKAGVPPFTLRKYRPQTKFFTKNQLQGDLEFLVDLFERMNSGRMDDQLAVETFIFRLCTRKS